MIKIAVCGYSSSVGRYFLERYGDAFEFVLLGRKDPDIYLDLRERKLSGDTAKLNGCRALIDLAAQTEDKSYDEIVSMTETNVLGSLFLAETCRQYGIGKMIHVSSISATYGEDDPYYGFYAITKKTADEMLALFCRRNGIALCVLRPSGLFGTEDFAKHQRLLYGMMDRVKRGETVCIYGTKDAKRNYLHVDTLCEVIAALTEKDVTGTYTVADPKNSALTEIFGALKRYYGSDSEVRFLPDKPDVEELCLRDDGEIYRKLGIKTPDGFEEQLRRRD